MELIFYEEAASLLGTSADVIKKAAVRGDLTRAGTAGHRQRVIKEQVMLFAGTNPRTGHKKQLSYHRLTPQEKELWQQYARECIGSQYIPIPAKHTVDLTTVEHIVEESMKNNLLTMVRELTSVLESGVPQGSFFRQASDNRGDLLRASHSYVSTSGSHCLQHT